MKLTCILLLGVVGAAASRSSSWGNLLEGVTGGLLNRDTQHGAAKALRGNGTHVELLAEEPADYNQQTEIETPEFAKDLPLPTSVEASVAGIWCLMIACIPIVLAKYGDEDIMTRTQIVEGVLLLVWLVGGIAAFTQVILFQSAHFQGIRSLTMVESTYLLTQILTTIGYGDITPAKPRGQVVVAFYILLSVLLVGNMFSQVVQIIQKRLALTDDNKGDFALSEDAADVKARLLRKESELLAEAREMEAPTGFEWVDPPECDNYRLLKAFVCYVVAATVGVLFFHLYPGEGKSLLEAIYMSIVTLSTVGFGAFTATTEVGKAFASFWMLVGVAALGNLCAACVEWSIDKRSVEVYCPDKQRQSWTTLIREMDRDDDGQIDESEFMKFALVHAGYATDEQVERIAQFFRRMHPDEKGNVPIEKFQMLGAPDSVVKTGRTTPHSPRGTPRGSKGVKGGGH